MDTVNPTLDILKWSIENINSLWNFLHLAIVAAVGAAWSIRSKVVGSKPFIAIAASYFTFALVNGTIIAANQKSAAAALNALKNYLSGLHTSKPLLETLNSISIIPVWQVVLFHTFLDIVVVTVIIKLRHIPVKE